MGTSTPCIPEDNEACPNSINSTESPRNEAQVQPGRWHQVVTVEPMLFLYMVAFSSTLVIVQSLYLETICEAEYQSDAEMFCGNLTSNSSAETSIQKIATTYSTYRSLIQSGLPVLFSLFIGPWTDKHGSKPIMLLSISGYITSSVLYYVLSGIKNLGPAMLLLASVPISLGGGIISFVPSAFRYLTTVTTEENRSFRMSLAFGSLATGTPFGLLGSAALSKSVGYQFVFLICIVFFTASFVYALFGIKSDKPPQDVNSPTHIWKDMFNLTVVQESFSTAFKSRQGARRLWLCLLLFTIFSDSFTASGGGTVGYLYTRKVFHWDVASYSVYSTYDSLVQIAGVSIAAVLGMKICGMSDTTVALLSAMSYLGGTLSWASSTVFPFGWMMYLGCTIQMFCGCAAIVARSMITKLVDGDEIGKVFSLLASGEAAVPFLTAPIYNAIYSKTVDSFPGAVYLFNSLLILVVVLIYGYFSASSWNAVVTKHVELENIEHVDELESPI